MGYRKHRVPRPTDRTVLPLYLSLIRPLLLHAPPVPLGGPVRDSPGRGGSRRQQGILPLTRRSTLYVGFFAIHIGTLTVHSHSHSHSTSLLQCVSLLSLRSCFCGLASSTKIRLRICSTCCDRAPNEANGSFVQTGCRRTST